LIVSIGRVPHTAGAEPGRGGPSSSTSAARSWLTTNAAPTCRACGPSATWCAARCSRTRPRKKGWRWPSASLASTATSTSTPFPWVIYTSPEIAWVGQTEQQLKAAGREYKAGNLPLHGQRACTGIGRHDRHGQDARPMPKTDEILGVHIVGPYASELISEAVVAMEFKASSEDIARICPRPSLVERSDQGSGPRRRQAHLELLIRRGPQWQSASSTTRRSPSAATRPTRAAARDRRARALRERVARLQGAAAPARSAR
jgi:dihydrolipoamide dehydrogenase